MGTHNLIDSSATAGSSQTLRACQSVCLSILIKGGLQAKAEAGPTRCPPCPLLRLDLLLQAERGARTRAAPPATAATPLAARSPPRRGRRGRAATARSSGAAEVRGEQQQNRRFMITKFSPGFTNVVLMVPETGAFTCRPRAAVKHVRFGSDFAALLASARHALPEPFCILLRSTKYRYLSTSEVLQSTSSFQSREE